MRSDLKLFFVVVSIFALSILVNMNVLDSTSSSSNILTGQVSSDQVYLGAESISSSFNTLKSSSSGCKTGSTCKLDSECLGDPLASPIVDGVCSSASLTCDCSPTSYCSSVLPEFAKSLSEKKYSLVDGVGLKHYSLEAFSKTNPTIDEQKYFSDANALDNSLVSDLKMYGYVLTIYDSKLISFDSVSSVVKSAIPKAQEEIASDVKLIDDEISSLNALSNSLSINLTNVTNNITSTNETLINVTSDLVNDSDNATLLAQKSALETQLNSLLADRLSLETQLADLSSQIKVLKEHKNSLELISKNMFVDIFESSKVLSFDDSASCCLDLVYDSNMLASFLSENLIKVVVALELSDEQVATLTADLKDSSVILLSYSSFKEFQSSFTSKLAANYGESLIIRGSDSDVSLIKSYLDFLRSEVEKKLGRSLKYFNQESMLIFNSCSTTDTRPPVFDPKESFYRGTTDVNYHLDFSSSITDNVKVDTLELVDNSIFQVKFIPEKNMYSLFIDSSSYPLKENTYYTTTIRATDSSGNVANQIFTLFVGSKNAPVDLSHWKTTDANVAHTLTNANSKFSNLGVLKTISFDDFVSSKVSSIVSNGQIVVVGSQDSLYAFDALTQKNLWSYTLPSDLDYGFSKLAFADNGQLVGVLSPVVSSDYVSPDPVDKKGAIGGLDSDKASQKNVINDVVRVMADLPSDSNDWVYSFNSLTGNLLFRKDLTFTVSSLTPTYNNEMTLLSSKGDNVATLDLVSTKLVLTSIKDGLVKELSYRGDKENDPLFFSSSSYASKRTSNLGLTKSLIPSNSITSSVVTTKGFAYYSIDRGVCKISMDLKPVWCTSIPLPEGDKLFTKGFSKVAVISSPPIVLENGNVLFVVDNSVYVLDAEKGTILSTVAYDNRILSSNLVASSNNLFSFSLNKSNSTYDNSTDKVNSTTRDNSTVKVNSTTGDNSTINKLSTLGNTIIKNTNSHPSWLVIDQSGKLVQEIPLSELSSVTTYAIDDNFIYVVDSASGKVSVLGDVVLTPVGSSHHKDLSYHLSKQTCDEGSQTRIKVYDKYNNPLSNVRADFSSTRNSFSKRSNSDGEIVDSLPSGSYTVNLLKSGYKDKEFSFTLAHCPIIIEVDNNNNNETPEPEENVTVRSAPEEDSEANPTKDDLISEVSESDSDVYGSNHDDKNQGSIFDTTSKKDGSSVKFRSTTATFSWFIFLVLLLVGIALYVSHKKSTLVVPKPKNRLRKHKAKKK